MEQFLQTPARPYRNYPYADDGSVELNQFYQSALVLKPAGSSFVRSSHIQNDTSPPDYREQGLSLFENH